MAAPSPVHYCGAPLAVDFGEQDYEPVVCLVDATPTMPARLRSVIMSLALRHDQRLFARLCAGSPAGVGMALAVLTT